MTRPLRYEWQDAWAVDPNVSDSLARTLVCCQKYVNSQTGIFSASEKTIAKDRGLSERQVARHFSAVVALGYFSVSRKGGGTITKRIDGVLRKVGLTTEYKIEIPRHVECQGTEQGYPDISDTIPRHLEAHTPTFESTYPDIQDVRVTVEEPHSTIENRDSAVTHSAPDSLRPSISLSKEKEVESPWPVASHSELALSRIQDWKARGEFILQENRDPVDEIATRVAFLLGYSPNAAKDTPERQAVLGEIKAVLTKDAATLQQQVAAIRAGTVSMSTLAHWAATQGFIAIADKDKANAAA